MNYRRTHTLRADGSQPNGRRGRCRRLGLMCGWLVSVCALVLTAGCVRRTLTINTEPSGALVLLNDEEVGHSPVTTDFTWYGDYDVIVRHPGYETLKTHLPVRHPWYQIPPIDFFFEVLWPGRIHDARSYDFSLVEAEAPTRPELIERAEALRDRALFEAD